MSEGLLLYELMRILEITKNLHLRYVDNKIDFFQKLNNVKEDVLHIGAHGRVKKGVTGLDTPKGSFISCKEITEKWDPEANIPELVVLSACEAGHIDLVRAFSDAGVEYVIAPLHETYWDDAAIFLSMFYKLIFSEESSPWIAYRNALCGYETAFGRISGAWRYYKDGELEQVECI